MKYSKRSVFFKRLRVAAHLRYGGAHLSVEDLRTVRQFVTQIAQIKKARQPRAGPFPNRPHSSTSEREGPDQCPRESWLPVRGRASRPSTVEGPGSSFLFRKESHAGSNGRCICRTTAF